MDTSKGGRYNIVMAYKMNLLKAMTIKKAKCPTSKPDIYMNDGCGLRLKLKPIGSKIWTYRFKINGVAYQMGLGSYNHDEKLGVTLDMARRKRDIAMNLVKQKIHPKSYFEKLKKENIKRTENPFSFGLMYTSLIKYHTSKRSAEPWSKGHTARYMALYNNYLKPQKIDNLSLNDITKPMLIEIIRYVEDNPIPLKSGKKDVDKYPRKYTMKYVKTLISMVYNHAEDYEGYMGNNPVASLRTNKIIKTPTTKNHPSVPVENAGEFWHLIKDTSNYLGDELDKLFLMINITTTLRVGAQSKLTWEMYDSLTGRIEVPPELMKSGSGFTTTIPSQLNKELQQLQNKLKPLDDEYIFLNKKGDSHYQPERARLLIQRIGSKNPQYKKYQEYTAHGNRAFFTDINELQGFPMNAIEYQLSHKEPTKNKITNAYRRGLNYIKVREEMVEATYNYLEEKEGEYLLISGKKTQGKSTVKATLSS